MRFNLYSGIIWVALHVNAQSVPDLPSCSLQCFATAVGQTGCGSTDYVCQCTTTNAATIRSSVTTCLASSTCSLSDLQQIQAFSNTFCPSIQSSAAAHSTVTSLTSSATSHISSFSTSSVSKTVASQSATTLASSSLATSTIGSSFGAGTQGTSWGELHYSSSKTDRGPTFEATSIILVAVAAMFLAFRFFARLYTKRVRRIVKGLGSDEWFAVAALVVTAGVTADIAVGNRYGMGRHLSPDTTSTQIVAVLKLVYVFVSLITASFALLKFSILSLYLRMTPERSHRTIIWIIISFVIAHSIAALFGAIFQCTPISAYWSLGDPLQNPSCFNILAFDAFNSAWSLFEDIIIWLLPFPIIHKLKVPFSRKSGLYVLEAISFIAVACATVRVAALILWIRSPDISWNYPLLPFLGNMEACVALMTSSVPAIYPLFRTAEPNRRWPQPPLPMQGPEKEVDAWDSQDSQGSSTVVPSKAVTTDRSSTTKRWSFLSRHGSLREKFSRENKEEAGEPEGGRPVMPTIPSDEPRTELKSVWEEEKGRDVVPGLAV